MQDQSTCWHLPNESRSSPCSSVGPKSDVRQSISIAVRRTTPVPYPAATQEEGVAKARAARDAAQEITGWSSGREGSVVQKDGTKLDVLFIEGSLPGMNAPLELLTYYRNDPFRLIAGFMWTPHPQVRKDPPVFMADFQRGIHMHPFGQQCMSDLQNAERVQLTR